MKKIIVRFAIGIAAVGTIPNGKALITLSFEPTPQSVSAGGPVSVDIVVSGLGNLAFPSVGAFDIDFTYNAAVLSAVSVAFGSSLDVGALGSSQFSDLSTAGLIHLDEVSLEAASALNNAQAGSITLGTLGFTGLVPGTSPLILTFASLSDENGESLEFTPNTGLIEVTGTRVPDGSSTASLLGACAASCFYLKRRHAKS